MGVGVPSASSNAPSNAFGTDTSRCSVDYHDDNESVLGAENSSRSADHHRTGTDILREFSYHYISWALHSDNFTGARNNYDGSESIYGDHDCSSWRVRPRSSVSMRIIRGMMTA
jgi:hypothetical protein